MENSTEMRYRQLGNSALNVSRVSFGCMSLKPEETNFNTVIGAAIDSGINFFDTADLYDHGLNEVCLGKALKEKRKQVIIATKVGNKWKPDGSGFSWNPDKKYIIGAVEDSLNRLQTDYIDLYQLHGGTIEDDIDDTIDAFETLKQQGKIRYYGISSIRPNVIREYVKRSNIVSVMMQYSLLDRRPEESCLQLLKEHNIGVLARGSVASGLLAGKEAKPYVGHNENEVKNAAKAIGKVTMADSNLAATAIAYVLQNAAISTAVVGIRNMQQLSETLQVLQKKIQFTEAEMQLLNNSILIDQYKQHR